MTVFHSAEWLQVLQETYGFEPLSVQAGGGTLSLMEAKGLLGGRRGVSLPFTDYCPPLVNSGGNFSELWSAATTLGRQRGWKYLELRGGKEWLPDAPASLRFYRHVLDLRGGEEALTGRFEDRARQPVRKAERMGVKVEKRQDLKAMRTYYRLHCGTRKKHGVPPQPWAFFLNIHKHLVSKGLGVLLLAQMDQIAVAGAVFLYREKKAIFKFGASDETRQEARGNNLVLWEGIRWLAEQGCEELDFGRTSVNNEGLRRFKTGWGGREETIEYVKYDLSAQRFMVDKDRATGWHNQIFRKMPMVLLRAAGTLLYPRLT